MKNIWNDDLNSKKTWRHIYALVFICFGYPTGFGNTVIF